ncbi:hypothetical protein FIBSPDRAFT_65632 [Athelia psychrophila]|uniref:Uncharacterized protein n=1 Tax=Athelia psychrophila TaxID=1759441 RepID=A0A166EX80_9AGAM|nr:hypothetical protein FIBSPDRAFT_65632 [Fibularhizoctonia sp. CBS 109695]
MTSTTTISSLKLLWINRSVRAQFYSLCQRKAWYIISSPPHSSAQVDPEPHHAVPPGYPPTVHFRCGLYQTRTPAPDLISNGTVQEWTAP